MDFREFQASKGSRVVVLNANMLILRNSLTQEYISLERSREALQSSSAFRSPSWQTYVCSGERMSVFFVGSCFMREVVPGGATLRGLIASILKR